MSSIKLLQSKGSLPESLSLPDLIRALNQSLLRVRVAEIEGSGGAPTYLVQFGSTGALDESSVSETETAAADQVTVHASAAHDATLILKAANDDTYRAYIGVVGQTAIASLYAAQALKELAVLAASDIVLSVDQGVTVHARLSATALTVAVALLTPASTTARAGARFPHGTAPTSPVDGDMWSTTAGLFIRINGVTKTVTLT